jgi:hypothetical protein
MFPYDFLIFMSIISLRKYDFRVLRNSFLKDIGNKKIVCLIQNKIVY